MLDEIISTISANFYLRFLVRVLVILLIFAFLKKLSRLYLRKLSERIIKSREPTESKRSKRTRIVLLDNLISGILVILAVLLILAGIPQLKALSYSLLASAGIFAVIIGFATQKTLSNVISGIFLALYEPFRVGDKIRIFNEYGEIEDLTLRHTIVRTWDNKRIVIPNSVIDEKEIINYSIKEEKVMWTTNIGISYDSDIDKAKKIMIQQARKHPSNLIHTEKGAEYEPFVRVTECGDFSVNLRLYFWCEDAWVAWKMGYDLTESIKKEFDRKGIEIPFPYRTIVYKKDIERKKRRK